MENPRYELIEVELKGDFGSDNVDAKTLPDGRRLFRLRNVHLPQGCKPEAARVLLVYANPSAVPEILAEPGILLPNGNVPRNLNSTSYDGEAWVTFSAQWSWDGSQSIERNVRRRIWRFGWLD
jgi:hypothetical protein